MAGTYDGLSVPLYGGYVRGSSDQTTTLTVAASNNAHDFVMAHSATTADNMFGLDVDVSGSFSSGYTNCFYVDLKVSGNLGGGVASNQVNAFGADITLDGTSSAAGYGGMYIYIAKSGTWSDTSAVVYGACLDIQEVGSVDYKCNLWLQNSSSTAASVDAYILISGQGASGGINSPLFYVQGQTYFPYLLKLQTDGASGFFQKTAMGQVTNSTGSLLFYAGSAKYAIPFFNSTTA